MEPNTGCPVCNGFDSLDIPCPECGDWMEDRGRFFDLLADYSPYRPIDDMKKSDGLRGLQTHQCPHQVYCHHCGFYEVSLVAEQPI